LSLGRIEDGDPLPVGAGSAALAAACDAAHDRCAAVGCGRRPVAGQRVEVGEVLLAGTVELDLGVATARRLEGAADHARRRAGADLAESVATVAGAVPHAALGAGAGRPAAEDAAL